jgi:hypothetical protein
MAVTSKFIMCSGLDMSWLCAIEWYENIKNKVYKNIDVFINPSSLGIRFIC